MEQKQKAILIVKLKSKMKLHEVYSERIDYFMSRLPEKLATGEEKPALIEVSFLKKASDWADEHFYVNPNCMDVTYYEMAKQAKAAFSKIKASYNVTNVIVAFPALDSSTVFGNEQKVIDQLMLAKKFKDKPSRFKQTFWRDCANFTANVAFMSFPEARKSQIVLDPLEYDFSKTCGYPVQRLSVVKSDNTAYFPIASEAIWERESKQQKIKDLRFVFGYTNLNFNRYNPARPAAIKIFEQTGIESDEESRVFKRTSKENTSVNQKEYLDYISRASTTLVIPSYKSETVSLMRFEEALARGCVPIFLEKREVLGKYLSPRIADYLYQNDLIVSNAFQIHEAIMFYSDERGRSDAIRDLTKLYFKEFKPLDSDFYYSSQFFNK